MRSQYFLVTLLLATVSLGVHAAPEILPLEADKLWDMDLESIPPFLSKIVLKGESENWESVLHQGEFVVSVFAASPAIIDVSDRFSYDEFVLVLEGEDTLTNVEGGTQTYKRGETFLVPKGSIDTWDMPFKYRELIVIETDALLAGEL